MPKGGFLKKVISLFLLCGTSLAAPHNEPWFKPLWEIFGRVEYDYFKNKEIVAPHHTFAHDRVDHIFGFALQTTPWPYWNAEIEIDFDASRPSLYEVTYLTGSYLWLDELACDCINLSLGLTAFFPNGNFLRDPSFLFVGKVNLEPFAAFGKELNPSWRLWGYTGLGFADRGRPWYHCLLSTIWEPLDCVRCDLGLEYWQGFGHHNITTISPFVGYANVAYRRLNVDFCLTYLLSWLGSLSLDFDYNIYARNSSLHNYDLMVCLSVPFSL